jgi:hypothetical protein
VKTFVRLAVLSGAVAVASAFVAGPAAAAPGDPKPNTGGTVNHIKTNSHHNTTNTDTKNGQVSNNSKTNSHHNTITTNSDSVNHNKTNAVNHTTNHIKSFGTNYSTNHNYTTQYTTNFNRNITYSYGNQGVLSRLPIIGGLI